MIRSGRDREARTTVALCFLLSIIEGYDIQALGVAAPKLVPELGFSLGQMGWIFAVGNVGLVIGSLIGGRLADHWGRKKILVGSVVTFATFTFSAVFILRFDAFVVARFLTGLGFGSVLPIMMATSTELSAPNKRIRTAAKMFCGMPIGGGIVALLTQALPPTSGWRPLFVAGGLLPLSVATALQWKMPETFRPLKTMSARAMPVVHALFGEGRAVPTLLLWLTFLPTLMIMYLFLNWLPLLVAAKHFDRAVTPQASAAFNFGSVVGALLLGWWIDRVGSRWPLAVCYCGMVAVLWLLIKADALSEIIGLSAATGFFMLGANFPLNGIAPAHYPPSGRGTGAGASIAAGRIGAVIGPLIAGMMLNGGLSAANVIAYTIPAALLAGVAAFSLSFFPTEH